MQRILHKMCKCPLQLPGTKYCSTTVCMFSAVHVMYYFCNFCRNLYYSQRERIQRGYSVNCNKRKEKLKDVVGAETGVFKVLLCAKRGEQLLDICFELYGHIVLCSALSRSQLNHLLLS